MTGIESTITITTRTAKTTITTMTTTPTTWCQTGRSLSRNLLCLAVR